MSDIVLKDKSGVKNTYSDIETINIPDGNGGFVKYSLGGTHLPEYDGTVIIEKSESVRGLRRLKENVEIVGTFDDDQNFDFEPIYNQYGFEITPIVIEDLSITIIGLSCAFMYGGYPTLATKQSDGSYDQVSTALMDVIGITEFNILSTANSTVDDWLLANTEGVSV